VKARIHLEVPLAGLAAQNATEETAKELAQAMDDARGHHPGSDEFRLADARFHRVIARTAGNELLRAFTSWTLDVLQPQLVARISDVTDGEAILQQHRDIMRAIKRGQTVGAQRAMRRHLEYVLDRTLAAEKSSRA
jgi:GntR family transcriptional repressor for pyruvate dehydrogenase complex